ncbi:virulence factor [Novosphingobium sp. G106]|uniref:virulence factor n=1 Tax=Novosphingobium sp. G106 TaxID=2849500 RepID=UPI001C2DE300|nr:virulence factor [Novosphingobium sp. G106]MBV1687269.1 virulence factor [Novosphingobium sp. G106]
MSGRFRRTKRTLTGLIAGIAVTLLAVFAVGGYFSREAYVFEPATGGRSDGLVAVFWSGDMGTAVGLGSTVIERLRADGIPVLTVRSPVLFARARDAGFADRVMTLALRRALAEAGAQRIAVVGSSFGSDMVVASLGHVPPDLRARISAVAVVGAGKDIYFHANPSGFFYSGPSAVDPAVAVPLLKGLPVTCIYGSADDETLCPEPEMAGARQVRIKAGHAMLWSHDLVADKVLEALRQPPQPLH